MKMSCLNSVTLLIGEKEQHQFSSKEIDSTFEQFPMEILKHKIHYIFNLGKIQRTYKGEDRVDIEMTVERFQWQMRDTVKFSEKLSMNVITVCCWLPQFSQ